MNSVANQNSADAPGASAPPMELVCPAGSLPALKAAVDHGANCVYLGLRDATNARNFAGLNFDEAAIASGIRYAHERGARVFMALNTYPQAANPLPWRSALNKAVDLGVNAVILADPGLMQYACTRYPDLRLHLSVQGSATNYEAINFYREHFGVVRAVLPRVLSLTQVEQLIGKTAVEIEVFGFGSLCVMVEGRCALSSYVTGESPNTHGVCSPPKAVRWQETLRGLESRLNGVLIESGSDVSVLHKIAGNGLGAVHAVAGKRPFVADPHRNLYNLPSLQWMATLGASRRVLPLMPVAGCNGYWHGLPGLEQQGSGAGEPTTA